MKSYNVKISFNMEIIGDDEDMIKRVAAARVEVAGHAVSDFDVKIVNSREIKEENDGVWLRCLFLFT